MSAHLDPGPPVPGAPDVDAHDLGRFGYQQSLRRSMGWFASFAVAFSMISVTNAVFFLFATPFQTIGGRGVWLFLPALGGIGLIVLTYAHLGARIPLTGYAYQWNSRMINRQYGFFSGWTALLAFFAGTASIGTALAVVFAPTIWQNPSKANILLFAGIVILAAAALNVTSIKATSLVNNVGVAFEIIGSLAAAVILFCGVFFVFKHSAGFSILFDNKITDGQGAALSITGIGAAALLPVYTLLGWEGAADLAEETKDARRVTPTAMIRANWTSTIASLIMIIAFAVAIPHGVADRLAQTKNPLSYIFEQQVGSVPADILQVVVFIAIFSCLLANMAVATRMTFSLSRDNMLPGSKILGHVDARTGTPIASVVLVAVVAFGVNLLSNGLAGNVVAIVNVCYYSTYALTLSAALWAAGRGRIPEALPGGFSLGRWLRPVATAGLLFALLIIADMILPQSGHVALKYFLGAQLVGLLWFLLVLRARLKAGTAGPGLTDLKLSPGAPVEAVGGAAPDPVAG
jgi:amino acid transporter